MAEVEEEEEEVEEEEEEEEQEAKKFHLSPHIHRRLGREESNP